MILCVHLTQEKVYHSLDVNFLTSDSFASCTEMDVIGNSILRFLILGSKTEKSKKKKRMFSEKNSFEETSLRPINIRHQSWGVGESQILPTTGNEICFL